MLAADNARLCGRLLAAEKVVLAARDLLGYAGAPSEFKQRKMSEQLQKALDAYAAAREN